MGQIERKLSRASSVKHGVIALAVLLTCAGPSGARPLPAPLEQAEVQAAPPARTVQQGGVSLQRAIQMAQQRHQGKVVRAETKAQNGRRVHEIRILGDDGVVRTVRFDADGGR